MMYMYHVSTRKNHYNKTHVEKPILMNFTSGIAKMDIRNQYQLR